MLKLFLSKLRVMTTVFSVVFILIFTLPVLGQGLKTKNLETLLKIRKEALLGGGEKRIESQHAKGKYTAQICGLFSLHGYPPI